MNTNIGKQIEIDNANKPREATVIDAVFERLSRVTSSGLYIPHIDGLRFIAILSVILYHLNGYFSAITTIPAANFVSNPMNLAFQQGYIGVQLFFAISGFILALPFALKFLDDKPSPSLKKYFLRRITRLEPTYIINLTICLILVIIVSHPPIVDILKHFLAGLGYAHSLIYRQMNPLNIVVWSLEIEIQFYILAPLFARVFLVKTPWMRRCIILLMAIAGIILTQLMLHYGYNIVKFTLLCNIQFFLVGFLLVDLYLNEWKTKQQDNRILWDILATIAWVSIFVVTAYDWYINESLPVLILIAYIGAFRGNLWPKLLCNRWLITIGGMCYTIYLYHYFIISAIGRVSMRIHITNNYIINYIIQFSIIGVFLLVMCSLLFLLFEKPFMYRDWLQTWKKKSHRGLSEYKHAYKYLMAWIQR